MTYYNPKNVKVAIDGTNVTGFAEDSFIAIEAKEDGIVSSVGCDGEIMRTNNPNKQYTIRLVLQQTSKANGTLLTNYKTDRSSGSGAFTVAISEADGTNVFSGTCWVARPATWQRGKTAGNMEWTLESDNNPTVDNF